MRKILLLAILSLAILNAPAFAQQKGYTSVQYAFGFASGDMGKYIGKTSFRGILFEYRHHVTPSVQVGADIGWNVFYERKDYDTYTANTVSLTGVQYRYHNEIPMFISGEYFFTKDQPFTPYAGLGIGTIYSERETDMGLFYVNEDAWQFALRPEAGFLYELSDGLAFKLAVKYYNGFKGGDLESQSYFSVSTGFALVF
jgi:outer membrane protein W